MRPKSIISDIVNDTDIAHTRDNFFSRNLLKGKSNMANKVAKAIGTIISCPIQIMKPIANRQNKARKSFTRKEWLLPNCIRIGLRNIGIMWTRI